MRLSIAPAATLAEAGLAAGRELADQQTLDAQLRKTPGQRAALAGFVRWLRETHEIALTLPPRRGATALNQRRAEARQEMVALLREGAGANDFAERWHSTALRYFHDVGPKTTRSIRNDDVETDEDGLRIDVTGQRYWIPSPPDTTAKGAKT